jgi:YVTN family beta-propeller protein
VGAQVVLSGRDFGNPSLGEIASVSFNGVIATAIKQDAGRVVVTVPAGATSGPVRVRKTANSKTEESNALFFEVFTNASYRNLRQSVLITDAAGEDINAAAAMRPQGDVEFVGTNGGRILAYDTRPGSPTFHQRIGHFLATGNATTDLAVTADGKALLVVASGSPQAVVLAADPNAPNFGEDVQAFTLDSGQTNNLQMVETSPDNKYLALYDRGLGVLGLFDATDVANGHHPLAIATVNGAFISLKFNPSGLALYIGESSIPQLQVMNTDPSAPEFTSLVDIESIPGPAPQEIPTCLATTPDGLNLYALTQQVQGPVARSIVHWPVNALTGVVSGGAVRTPMESGGTSRLEKFAISPRGDTAVRTQASSNLHYMDLTTLLDINQVGSAPTLTNTGIDFDPTGQRLYYTDTVNDGLRVFELNTVAVMYKTSGDTQNGVTGQLLTAPLRVNVYDQLEFGFGVPGVSMNFDVTQGGGLLKVGGQLLAHAIIATDAQGFAQVEWQLGTAGQTQEVTVTGAGILGSPITFTATSAPDPETLPLSLSEALPLQGTSSASASTAIITTFSRAIDPATITGTTLFMQSEPDATKVPVTYGFTDGNRKVSMTPTKPLKYAQAYGVYYTAGIKTPAATALTNPGSTGWSTGVAPPLTLQAISPPSALVGVNVTLSGAGFDPNPGANTVHFNGADAIPVSGTINELVVKVPATAIPGNVTVTRSAVTSNAVNFTVLVPTQSPIDEVIATIGTGSGAKSCTVSPDGTLCYTVSPDGNVVIPVDINGQTTYQSISVGDQPVAIVMRPDGKAAYVANFNSNSVSVIDTDKNSATFNTVINTIIVGTNPTDLAVYPDGDRLVVANAGSGDVSVIDTDGSSVSYHTVIATVGQGTGAKSVTVTPDGTLLFILTTAGTILVVDVHPGSNTENQVIATVGAGSGAKGLTVSPDGTLLFVIQENSDIVLVIAISVIPGVGAANGNASAAAPSFTFHSSVIDQITMDSSPAFVAVDPSGTGKLFVPTPGNKMLNIINASDVAVGPVPASVVIAPSTLNLNSNGKYVTGQITLSLPFFTQEIVPTSVKLQGTIPALPGTATITDTNSDGIKELNVKFDRAAFQALLPQGEFVPVTVTGDVRNRTFAGVDTIRTLRPTVVKPHGNDHLAAGAPTQIQWTTPNGYASQISSADIHFSGDNGTTWTQIANKIANTGTFTWTTPANVYLPQCRIMVTLNGMKNDVFGQGMNQDPFAITAPVAVRLKSASAIVVDGDAVVRWETNFEDNVSGFQIARAEAEDGVFAMMTKEPIAAHGAVAGSAYEFHDASIRPNRSYWYKLVEVTTDGVGTEFGPYSVAFRVTNALEQNMPNPFNPATTIKYSIAQDVDVSLVVYNVSGQRVRSLVDTHQRADVYKVTWDGLNDQGQRVASGMYFYKLVAGKFVQTRKMVLLK